MIELLLPQEKYLEAGVHIGTKTRHGSMRKYIYKSRGDGLHVLDLKKMDEKIRLAAKMLAAYEPSKVFVVGSKDNAKAPIAKFCELTGFQSLAGRFTPGKFTNPQREDFAEPEIVVVVDPGVDRQAVRETFSLNVPVIALCDTNNSAKYIDLVIPTNNKGRKAIALMFWLVAREVLKLKGAISSNEEFGAEPREFEA